jgi:hypothetical protein
MRLGLQKMCAERSPLSSSETDCSAGGKSFLNFLTGKTIKILASLYSKKNGSMDLIYCRRCIISFGLRSKVLSDLDEKGPQTRARKADPIAGSRWNYHCWAIEKSLTEFAIKWVEFF